MSNKEFSVQGIVMLIMMFLVNLGIYYLAFENKYYGIGYYALKLMPALLICVSVGVIGALLGGWDKEKNAWICSAIIGVTFAVLLSPGAGLLWGATMGALIFSSYWAGYGITLKLMPEPRNLHQRPVELWVTTLFFVVALVFLVRITIWWDAATPDLIILATREKKIALMTIGVFLVAALIGYLLGRFINKGSEKRAMPIFFALFFVCAFISYLAFQMTYGWRDSLLARTDSLEYWASFIQLYAVAIAGGLVCIRKSLVYKRSMEE